MKKTRRVWGLLFALSLVFALLPVGGAARAADYIAANHTKNNNQPYYIMVNRAQNTVTIYGLDEAGYYTVPVKAMVCSVGRQGHGTPRGTFAITGTKKEWCLMLDGSYGQYSSQFSGYYLFHSVCYSKADPAALLTEEYNMLGEPASLGCVRLQVADAKWIYDNCAAGTKVTIYDGEDPGPLGKPETLVPEIAPEQANGWDPTDPRAENPWGLVAQSLSLDETDITLEAGMRRRLWPAVSPETAIYPGAITWTVDDPAVVSVDPVVRVTGLSAGTAVVTARCGERTAQCTVTVEGELLRFEDVAPGSWYYSDVRYAYEHGIFSGTGAASFAPEETMTRASMAQILYNMAGRPQTGAVGGGWADSILNWAGQMGLLDGAGTGDGPLTRQAFVIMLYRFQTGYLGKRGENYADLSGFGDQESLAGIPRTAMSWAVGNGLLQGTSENLLAPDILVPRAQAATILRRYHTLFGA